MCNQTTRQSVLTTATEEISFKNFTHTDIILFQDIWKKPWEKGKQAYVLGCEKKPHTSPKLPVGHMVLHLIIFLRFLFIYLFSPHNHNRAVCAVLHWSPVGVRQCDLQ